MGEQLRFFFAMSSTSDKKVECSKTTTPRAMMGENRQLVIDEPVEVQDYRKITDRFRGMYKNIPQFDKGEPEDVNM